MTKRRVSLYVLFITYFFSINKYYSQVVDVTTLAEEYRIEPNDDESDAYGINKVLRDSHGITLLFPKGVYIIDETIDLRQNNSILGTIHNNSSASIWKVKLSEDTPSLNTVVQASERPGLSFQNILIECAGKSKFGMNLIKVSRSETLLENIVVKEAIVAGFRFEKCQAANFQRLLAEKNLGDGFHIIDCNSSFFTSLQAVENQGNGFSISSEDYSGACFLNMGRAEKNKGNGVFITGAIRRVIEGVVIDDFWIELNRMDGVKILNARAVKIRDSKIIGFDSSITTSRAIRLCNSEQCVIDGNIVSGGDLPTYRIVEILQGSTGNTVTGNSLIAGSDTYRPLPVLPEAIRDAQRSIH